MSLTIPVRELFSKREGITSKHDSWEEIELKDAITVQNGFPFESKLFNVDSNGEPLIRIRDILNHKSETYYNGNYDQSFIVRKGDLLVGMDGDFNCTLWRGENGLLNQRVCRLIPNESVLNKKFLFYGIGGYLKRINENTSSVTVKHLSSNSIKEIPFPLPPLPEQKRIVAKLDTLFAHLDQLKARLEKIPTLLKQFRQAVLTQAVTGKLSDITNDVSNSIVIGEPEAKEPSNWKWVKLVDVAQLESGHTPRKSVAEYWDNGTIPWISLQDIREAHGRVITETKYYTTEKGIKNSSARLLPKGTVCFCRDISVGFVTMMGTEMSTTQHFANWVCSDKLNNYYLMYCFMASRQSLIASGKGTTVGTIYMPALKEMRVLLPPLNEQKEIVHRIESLFSLADRIEASYQTLKEKIDQLPQAILSKAFRGELVGQNVSEKMAEYKQELDKLSLAAEP